MVADMAELVGQDDADDAIYDSLRRESLKSADQGQVQRKLENYSLDELLAMPRPLFVQKIKQAQKPIELAKDALQAKVEIEKARNSLVRLFT